MFYNKETNEQSFSNPTPVASFSRLVKCPLVFNGHLANHELTPLVKEATDIYICDHQDALGWAAHICNICSGNGLEPSGNKPLFEPVRPHFNDTSRSKIWLFLGLNDKKCIINKLLYVFSNDKE